MNGRAAERTEDQFIVFVCTGNICRSPMADVMFTDAVEEAGLDDHIRVASCGLGGWHEGEPADERAIEVLRRHGFDGSRHRAKQFGPATSGATLFVAMDQSHVRGLRGLGVPREKIRLMRSFDQKAGSSAEVRDPYYDDIDAFEVTFTDLAPAIPGLLRWCKSALAEQSGR